MTEQISGPAPFAADSPAEVLARTHTWFHDNSGWAPPDVATLDDWLADGVCRAPDECLVRPRSWCEHGLASWVLVLDELAELDARSHGRSAAEAGRAGSPPDEPSRLDQGPTQA